MIIVTGAILARPECIDELRSLSVEHVRRSRAEPGCIAHNVSVDVENELRLVFVEYWADLPSLMAHFKLQSSLAFVDDVRDRVSAPPEMKIFDATEIRAG